MSMVAIEHERAVRAERLLAEIAARHAVMVPAVDMVRPELVDRFLVVYLPEARLGEPAPDALEYAFTASMADGLDLLRRVIVESSDGAGASAYIHDLDTGLD